MKDLLLSIAAIFGAVCGGVSQSLRDINERKKDEYNCKKATQNCPQRAGKGGENGMRGPLKKVILTFYKNGCPKRFEENDQWVENWNGGEISFHFFSWHGNHKGMYPSYGGDDPVKMSQIKRDRSSPEKVEAYFDEKERLATVIIDGNKAYDRLDPAFASCRTELIIDSKECGSELTVLLKHDFIHPN